MAPVAPAPMGISHYGPPMPAYAPPPPVAPQGMNPALIALIAIAALVVVGAGGCVFCVCVGAAASSPAEDAAGFEATTAGSVRELAGAGSSSTRGRVGLPCRAVIESPDTCSHVQLSPSGAISSSRTKSAVAASSVAASSSQTKSAVAESLRAHSSIGQSPRLITGLFLVRTQVGPRYPASAVSIDSQGGSVAVLPARPPSGRRHRRGRRARSRAST